MLQDMMSFLVALLATMREALLKRFVTAKRSTISLAAKLAVLIKADSTGSAAVLLRKWYRDEVASSTTTTDELDPKGFFQRQARKLIEDDLLSKGKKIVEDDAFNEAVAVKRVDLMKVYPEVQRIALPIKLFGKVGTVWLLKTSRVCGHYAPHGNEGSDTLAWEFKLLSDDFKVVGRKLMAASMALSLLDIENGPDSTGLFEVSDDRELNEYEEALQDCLIDSEGETEEDFETEVGERVKLFDRVESNAERLEYLINADGGPLARTKTAEEKRLFGATENDERIAYAEQIMFGEQILSVETLDGETILKVDRDFRFDGYIQYLCERFFVAHQSFPEFCRPNTMGKTGFKAGRPFYTEGFGRGRLAVKGEDSFLLFTLPVSYTATKEEVSERLKAQGSRRSKEEFFDLVRRRMAQVNQGRAELLPIGPFQAFAGQTVALRFRKGSDTARLIQRLSLMRPLPQWQIAEIPAEQVFTQEV